jgi:hypothetical protein
MKKAFTIHIDTDNLHNVADKDLAMLWLRVESLPTKDVYEAAGDIGAAIIRRWMRTQLAQLLGDPSSDLPSKPELHSAPLNELRVMAAHLCNVVRDRKMTPEEVTKFIRSRIDAALADPAHAHDSSTTEC